MQRSWSLAAGIFAAWPMLNCAVAFAKTPGQTYCFHGVCHRVLTVEETTRAVGRTETVVASFYDDPKKDAANPDIMTSSGERFDPRSSMTVASPIYPNGTRLLLWNPKTRAAAEVRVTNSGPYHGARRLDVSPRAAEQLGFRPLGVSQLTVTVIAAPTVEQATYRKGRTYAPVAGYLGVFDSQARGRLAAILAKTENVSASTAKTAAVPQLPQPVHTGSVGWSANARPVRPPLQRGPTAVPAPVPVPSLVSRAPAAPAAAVQPPAQGRRVPPPDWATTLTRTETAIAPALGVKAGSPPSIGR